MNDDSKGCLLMFVIGVLLIVGIFAFIGGLEYLSCSQLEQKTGYNTAWVFPTECFVEYNGIWYPDSTLYKVLGNDFQYDLDLEIDN